MLAKDTTTTVDFIIVKPEVDIGMDFCNEIHVILVSELNVLLVLMRIIWVDHCFTRPDINPAIVLSKYVFGKYTPAVVLLPSTVVMTLRRGKEAITLIS